MHQLTDRKNKITIYILLLFVLSTTSGKFEENQKNHYFSINKINIQGLSNPESKNIFKQLNNLFQKNILFIKKEDIVKIINKYNIIEEYSINKIYPSTININIRTTKFIARLSNNDQLVGSNGKLIKNKEIDKILPYIFGEFNSKDFLIFKKNVNKSKFVFTEFKTLYFFPSNRWDILTNDNILIKLPQDNFSEAINLAYTIINKEDFKNKKLIDLRVNNHLIIE
ncbi:FtsQ-type POTRA domain-containing protein [Candidatus Pelagibacter sp.]|jgi:cell division protein FtsQ|nr:FtsQ-type POTRA domain-containing protein [Candidatus Pelagibacter sp.]